MSNDWIRLETTRPQDKFFFWCTHQVSRTGYPKVEGSLGEYSRINLQKLRGQFPHFLGPYTFRVPITLPESPYLQNPYYKVLISLNFLLLKLLLRQRFYLPILPHYFHCQLNLSIKIVSYNPCCIQHIKELLRFHQS